MYDIYVIGYIFSVNGHYFVFIGNTVRILLRKLVHRQLVLHYPANL